MKILGSKLILSKKPVGPQSSTMVASLVEVGAVVKHILVAKKKVKKTEYLIQYAQKHFDLNKALRASPEEIEKMSKEQVQARMKKYVLGNLGIHSAVRKVHSVHPDLKLAKKSLKDLIKRLQSR